MGFYDPVVDGFGVFLRGLHFSVDRIQTITSTKIGSSGLESSGVDGGCCKGTQHLKLWLWGKAVDWWTDFKFNSSQECCKACKDHMYMGVLWEEIWQDTGNKIMWTSGLIFGRGEERKSFIEFVIFLKGIVGLETEYGTLRIKLFPECSPQSVAYILDLLSLRHCSGLHFYRAEGRGQSWDTKGNHINDASFGPPFALIQGTLEPHGQTFTKIESEYCPTMRRGSVAWVGSGPSFFVSLADHEVWGNSYTVFGSVLPEDMEIAEKIGELPTKSDVWSNINVSVLESTVPLKIKRINIDHSDL
ncbi:hypothetical protein ACS0TY_000613 [Phlomoides rotata]